MLQMHLLVHSIATDTLARTRTQTKRQRCERQPLAARDQHTWSRMPKMLNRSPCAGGASSVSYSRANSIRDSDLELELVQT